MCLFQILRYLGIGQDKPRKYSAFLIFLKGSGEAKNKEKRFKILLAANEFTQAN